MSFSFLSCTLGSILSFSFPFSFFFQIFLHPWHLSFSHGNLMSASSTAVQRAILCFSLTDFNRPDFDLVAHQFLLKFSLVPEYLYTRTVPLLHFLPSWFSVCRSFLSLFSRFASAMALPMPCPQPPFTSFPASSFVQSFWVIWLSLLVPSVDVHLLTASNSGFFFFFSPGFQVSSRHFEMDSFPRCSREAHGQLSARELLISLSDLPSLPQFPSCSQLFQENTCEILISRPSLPGHTQ